MRVRCKSTVLVFLCALCVMAAQAAAQTTTPNAKAAADALFEQGRTLLAAGKYAEACQKFEASYSFEARVVTLMNLGACREKNQEHEAAWDVYRRAAEEARRAKDSTREQFARSRMQVLNAHFYLLFLEVPEQAAKLPGLRVSVDGKPVPDASWNQPLHVAAGAHVVKAEATGREPFESRVNVSTKGKEIRVSIPVLQPPRQEPQRPEAPVAQPRTPASNSAPDTDTPMASPAVTSSTDADSTGSTEITRPVDEDTGPGMPLGRKLALGSGVVGVIGLGLGTVFGVQASGLYGDAEDACEADEIVECSAEDRNESQELRDDARGRANLATASFAVGVAAAVAGVVLWYTSEPARTESMDRAEPGARLETMLGPGIAGLNLHVTF